MDDDNDDDGVIAQMETDLDNLNTNLSQYYTENDAFFTKLNGDLEDIINKIDDLIGEKNRLTQELEELNDKYNTSFAELEVCKGDLIAVKKELDILKSDHTPEERFQTQGEDLKETQENYRRLQGEMLELEKTNKRLTTEISDKEDKLRAIQGKISTLTQTFSNYRNNAYMKTTTDNVNTIQQKFQPRSNRNDENLRQLRADNTEAARVHAEEVAGNLRFQEGQRNAESANSVKVQPVLPSQSQPQGQGGFQLYDPTRPQGQIVSLDDNAKRKQEYDAAQAAQATKPQKTWAQRFGWKGGRRRTKKMRGKSNKKRGKTLYRKHRMSKRHKRQSKSGRRVKRNRTRRH